MRNIHIAADYYGLVPVEQKKIVPERVLPCHSVVEPCEPILRIGGIDADKIEVLESERYNAALTVVLGNADAV